MTDGQSSFGTPEAWSNINSLFGAFVFAVLERSGLKEVVLSPGSRSTPLAYAAHCNSNLNTIVHIDERSAAYYALGLVKSQGNPVALVCTSGTALANYYPAVIEASEAGLPLLVLTADRPAELRYRRAGQTIDQQKIYGTQVRHAYEMPLPENDETVFRQVRSVLLSAYKRCQFPAAGPVHVNFPFREPLAPEGNTRIECAFNVEALLGGIGSSPQSEVLSEPFLPLPGRGLVLAGPTVEFPDGESLLAIQNFLRKLGWPVLVDAAHPLRHRQDESLCLVSHYDSLIRDAKWCAANRPEAIIVLGEPPTSKVLRTWLSSECIPVYFAGESPLLVDPFAGITRQYQVNWKRLPDLLEGVEPVEDREWRESWESAEQKSAEDAEAYFAGNDAWFEGRVHRILSGNLPHGSPVMFANSLAIRDAEWFWKLNNRGYLPFSMRGGNGIDGTLSLACGIVEGRSVPGVLVTGELALLHDINGFLFHPCMQTGLKIFVVNNHGGGIFDHLPVSHWNPVYEEGFATPQEVDFHQLCGAHGVNYTKVATVAELESAAQSLPERGIEVVEIVVDRELSLSAHRAYFNWMQNED